MSFDDSDRFCRGCGATLGPAPAVKDDLVGRVIGGSFLIQELVGVGGMGRVYRAEQRMLGRAVAIKVIHPHLLSDELSVARFYTEAKAASRLNHPNSVSIIDFGRTEDGILYLVMEFLKGKDLYRLQHDEGLLAVSRACEIVSAVLDALAEAHALDVVHRDLKPENVIIERPRSGGDLVKVVDFGLAKLLGPPSSDGKGTTLPGLVCGTPDYMAPEQGRGYEVDGRGDIYTTGVMLFELLTGTLPYLADTPTGVVLRHIQDPIPDPRQVAPHRGISAELAGIVMRAMAKSPADRFAAAVDMAEALREVVRQLAPQGQVRLCQACGHGNRASDRFCSRCGAPLHAEKPSAFQSAPGITTKSASRGPALLVARDADLKQLQLWHQDSPAGHPRVIVVTGETGVGRTRLVSEFADLAGQLGHVVVSAGPHASGAPVPYHAMTRLVQALLAEDELGVLKMGRSLVDAAPLVAAGLLELGEPVGLRGADGESRASAVASALLYAVEAGIDKWGAMRALITIDDLDLCDGLTQEVVRLVANMQREVSFTLLVVDQPERDKVLRDKACVLSLRSLSVPEAQGMLEGRPPRSSREPDPDDASLLPLFVEQLRQLGLGLDHDMRGEQARLAELVAQRLDHLPADVRHVLQAVAVLGQRAEKARLDRLMARDCQKQVSLLKGQGLLMQDGESIAVAHPYVRDLVEASIPAEARKDLHARALALANEDGQALEVRAHHAYGTGEALGALVLLERMGKASLMRGDVDASVLGYQRALSLARRELLEKGDTFLEGVIESVSRHLGKALLRRGDVTGAEGVLREALEYSAPSSTHRAQVQLGLAEVLAAKQRSREAYRMLGQALEVGVNNDAAAIQVSVQLAVASLRRRDGNLQGALSALRSAEELLEEPLSDSLQRAQVAVEIARGLVDVHDATAARVALQVAQELAEAAKAPYLQASVQGILARLRQGQGDNKAAQQHYAEAAALAERAGDGRLAVHFRSLSLLDTVASVAPERQGA